MLPAVTSAHLQPDNRPNEGDDEENARRRNGLVKEGNAENYRTDRTNACPNGIGRANGQRVDSLGQKQHAHDKAYDEAGSPHIILNARLPLHLAETEGKGRLKRPATIRIIQLICLAIFYQCLFSAAKVMKNAVATLYI